MRRLLLILATMAITVPLWAAVDRTVTYVEPTERVNGDPLPLSEIAGYDLECRTTDGNTIYTTGLPPGTTSHQTPEVFSDGSFVCRMRTIDTEDRQSDWADSNVFTVGRCDVTDCSPRPPSSIVVIVQ